MKSSSEYRRLARTSLQGYWFKGALATLIAHGIVFFSSFIPFIGWAANFLLFPLYYGYDRYFLVLKRSQPENLGSLFIGFKSGNFGRTMWAYTLGMASILLWFFTLFLPVVFFLSWYTRMGEVIIDNPTYTPDQIWHESLTNVTSLTWSPASQAVLALWMLLLCIPGMLALARYSMIGLILVDRPELTGAAIVRESARITNGHKWAILRLTFSFTGWALVASLTGGIGFLWLSAYYRAALSWFYEDIRA